MSTAIEIVGFGGIVPAAVSIVVYLLCLRCLPAAAAQRYAPAAAVGISFFVGYALLPDWAPLRPERHWQWLPYLGAGAMIVGPIGMASGVLRPERWVLHALLAIASAWLLVPTWTSLQPARPYWILLLASYWWWLMAALDALPDRLLGRVFLAHLTLVALAVAILLAAAVSLKYAQVAGIAASGFGGCWVGCFFSKQPSAVRSLIPVFALLLGGAAFVGCIEPQPPLTRLLLAPAAPLVLWLFAAGPLAALQGKQAAVAQTAAVLSFLGAVLVWMLEG